jgi:release factor glutamine methyltransferase
MTNLSLLLKKYQGKIDFLDLELIIARVLKKSREFVLSHPEKSVSRKQETVIEKLVNRRIKHEPLAYILGEKEFYGLKFKVDKNTLIPRPETEMLVELVTCNLKPKTQKNNLTIIDIGTGSGNIIIAIASQLFLSCHSCESRNPEKKEFTGSRIPCLPAGRKCGMTFFGIDISKQALQVAKQNAKLNKVDKKIKFLKGNLLEPILKNKKYLIPDTQYFIVANLPYLSQEIYSSTPETVKKYEPKSALFSPKDGLKHYEELLNQVKKIKYEIRNTKYEIRKEISPEQKAKLPKIIQKYLPGSKTDFFKDLTGRWRVCWIKI